MQIDFNLKKKQLQNVCRDLKFYKAMKIWTTNERFVKSLQIWRTIIERRTQGLSKNDIGTSKFEFQCAFFKELKTRTRREIR